MNEHHHTLKTFRVRVGHAQLTVAGRDRTDAIQQARRRLGLDMPRMWDVVYKIDDKEFRVDEVH